jgi:hypothetical protein
MASRSMPGDESDSFPDGAVRYGTCMIVYSVLHVLQCLLYYVVHTTTVYCILGYA